jgi:hypothetical protein
MKKHWIDSYWPRFQTLGAIAVLMLLATACSQMVLVNSPVEKPDLEFIYNARYDAKSKIRYMVSNDAKRIYVRFDTDNRNTMMRVRKTGAIVRFDLEGKRKGKIWLKYPIYGEDQDLPSAGADGLGLKALFPATTTAIWTENENSKSIELSVEPDGLSCSVGIDSMDVLEYLVAVPFSQLGVNGPADLPDLAICLEIPNPDGPKSSGGSSMPSTMSGSASMPGQMPGPYGANTTPSMSTGGVSPDNPTIKIWMKVTLSKP